MSKDVIRRVLALKHNDRCDKTQKAECWLVEMKKKKKKRGKSKI